MRQPELRRLARTLIGAVQVDLREYTGVGDPEEVARVAVASCLDELRHQVVVTWSGMADQDRLVIVLEALAGVVLEVGQ